MERAHLARSEPQPEKPMPNFTRESARVAIKARIAAYLEGETSWLGGFEDIVRKHDALPVVVEFAACFVNPEGDVFENEFLLDAPKLTPVTEWARRMNIYLIGKDIVPEMEGFIPIRQPFYPDCPDCLGTGKLSADGKVLLEGKLSCPRCGGLKWVPPDEQDVNAGRKWVVLRQDDNGFRDFVRLTDTEAEAEALRAELESHGHKQMYWVERIG
jgi:hypothetical protein